MTGVRSGGCAPRWPSASPRSWSAKTKTKFGLFEEGISQLLDLAGDLGGGGFAGPELFVEELVDYVALHVRPTRVHRIAHHELLPVREELGTARGWGDVVGAVAQADADRR